MIISPKEVVDKRYVFPVSENQIQPNGIDLTLKSINQVEGVGSILKEGTQLPDYKQVSPLSGNFAVRENFSPELEAAVLDPQRDVYELSPHTVYELEFNEAVNIPDNLSAYIHHRSSIVRSGGIVRSGWYDSGFQHNTSGCFMSCHLALFLEKDTRIAQIIFFKSDSAGSYDGQFQGKIGEI